MTIAKSTLALVPEVAGVEEAWEMGTKVCWYRSEDMGEAHVILCNREGKGQLERVTVVDDVPVPVPVAEPVELVEPKSKGSASRRERREALKRRREKLAAVAVARKNALWYVWEYVAKPGAGMRWRRTELRGSYAVCCAMAAGLRGDGVMRLVLAEGSARPVGRWIEKAPAALSDGVAEAEAEARQAARAGRIRALEALTGGDCMNAREGEDNADLRVALESALSDALVFKGYLKECGLLRGNLEVVKATATAQAALESGDETALREALASLEGWAAGGARMREAGR